jgi:hypothetical protein
MLKSNVLVLVIASQGSFLILCFYVCHGKLMLDLDLCNYYHQNESVPYNLV